MNRVTALTNELNKYVMFSMLMYGLYITVKIEL